LYLLIAAPSICTYVQSCCVRRVAHFALFGLVKTEWELYAALALLLLTGPVPPYTRTILSNSVSVEEQARIFSAFSALEVLAVLLGGVFTPLFAVLLRMSAGWLIFEVFAVLTTCALGVIVYLCSCPDIYGNLPFNAGHPPKRSLSATSVVSVGTASPFVLLDGRDSPGDDATEGQSAADVRTRLLSGSDA
jgi:MFS family permease